MKTKKFTGDRIFDFVNVTVILLITIIILVPLFKCAGIFFFRKYGIGGGRIYFLPERMVFRQLPRGI